MKIPLKDDKLRYVYFRFSNSNRTLKLHEFMPIPVEIIKKT